MIALIFFSQILAVFALKDTNTSGFQDAAITVGLAQPTSAFAVETSPEYMAEITTAALNDSNVQLRQNMVYFGINKNAISMGASCEDGCRCKDCFKNLVHKFNGHGCDHDQNRCGDDNCSHKCGHLFCPCNCACPCSPHDTPVVVEKHPVETDMYLRVTPTFVVTPDVITTVATATSTSYELSTTMEVETKHITGHNVATIGTYTFYPETTIVISGEKTYLEYPGATIAMNN